MMRSRLIGLGCSHLARSIAGNYLGNNNWFVNSMVGKADKHLQVSLRCRSPLIWGAIAGKYFGDNSRIDLDLMPVNS